MKLDNSKNQLRWVILLLAIAVILPTVCLLFFMTQAVKNERLAVRQEVIDVYTKELEKARETYSKRWDKWRDFSHHTVQSTLKQSRDNCVLFGNFLQVRVGDMRGMPRIAPFTGVVAYDSKGLIEYPLIDTDDKIEYDLTGIFTEAWALEFKKQEYPEAVKVYKEISEIETNDYIKRLSIIGHARCLRKQGKLFEAYEICTKAAYRNFADGTENAELYEHVEQTKALSVPLIVQARILRISILGEMYEKQDPSLSIVIDYYVYGDDINGLWIIAYDDYSALSRALDAETRIYLLHKFIELADNDFLRNIMKKYPDPESNQYRQIRMSEYIPKARKRLIAEELALEVAKRYSTNQFLRNWPQDSLRKLDISSNAYAFHHEYLGKSYLTLVRPETIQIDLDALEDVFQDSLFDYKIIDSNYKHIAGITDPPNQMILETGLGEYFTGWKIRLYYKDVDVFEDAATQTKMIYGWTVTLVIGIMILLCGFAVRSVLHQAAVNTLKNDFIATVTHELKTPLASMRVLVDTLLEGNYNDQKQATEYLQLISKENKRLTGLIDNFLTFSRMERNKQSFEIVPTSPTEIAKDAIHAIKTKFAQGNCDFTTNIPENLPPVRADRDAIVTVLINLLGNAYKYSGDDKQIELTLFEHESKVFFKVKDNGKGMPPRVTRRIFDRFYQADSRLSRSAEGCGLGLSIVKFIVDAHKGTIEVQSKLNKGSEFTVIIPTA